MVIPYIPDTLESKKSGAPIDHWTTTGNPTARKVASRQPALCTARMLPARCIPANIGRGCCPLEAAKGRRIIHIAAVQHSGLNVMFGSLCLSLCLALCVCLYFVISTPSMAPFVFQNCMASRLADKVCASWPSSRNTLRSAADRTNKSN